MKPDICRHLHYLPFVQHYRSNEMKTPATFTIYWFWLNMCFVLFRRVYVITYIWALSTHILRRDIKFQRSINFIQKQNGNELFNGFLIENWADAFENAKYPNLQRWSMIKYDYGCWKFCRDSCFSDITMKMIFDEESSSCDTPLPSTSF